jgi:hypothetical protein
MDSDQLLTKSLGEEFTCVGEWWIPKEPDLFKPKSKHCGTLTLTRGEGIKLDVLGQLEGDKLPESPVGHPVEMIWGVSAEGELITLFECVSAGMTMGTVWTESYTVGRVFVSKNAWFTPGERITFTSLSLQYTHLPEWVGTSGFRVPSPNEFNTFIESKKAEIVYERPSDSRPINVRDFALSVRFGNSWPSIGPAIQEATIKQHTSIFVEPLNSKEITLNEAGALAQGIQNFLTLVMYADPIYPLVIEGQVKIEEKKSREQPPAIMRMFYEPIGTKRPSEKILRHDILFTYRDAVDIWEYALNSLVVIDDGNLKPSFNDFFAEYLSPSTYAEDRFVATVRAIEAFHRKTSKKDSYMQKEKYNETLLKKLNEQIDEAKRRGDINKDFQESLKKRLSCGYRYLLEKRLNDLFASHEGAFLTRFVGKKRREFVREIVATRNWLTHFDEEDRNEALEGGKELAYLNLKLQLFMITLLLRHIGFPSEQIEEKLKHHKFDYLRVSQAAASQGNETN